MEICLACSKNAAQGGRRVLHRPSSSHLIPVVRRIMEDYFSLNEVNRVLPAQSGDNENYYVCKNCFRSLESYAKAKKSVEDGILKVGQKLSMNTKVSNIGTPSRSSNPCSSGSLSHGLDLLAPVCTPKRKRSSNSIEPLSKRIRVETPVRDSISRMHVQDSPLLSVRELTII